MATIEPTGGLPPALQAIWAAKMVELDKFGIAEHVDLSAVESWCRARHLADEAWKDIELRGHLVDGARPPALVMNPSVRVHASATAEMRALDKAIGLYRAAERSRKPRRAPIADPAAYLTGVEKENVVEISNRLKEKKA